MITEIELRYHKKYRGEIESTEAEFRHPRNITEAEFWLMLHPDMNFIIFSVCNRNKHIHIYTVYQLVLFNRSCSFYVFSDCGRFYPSFYIFYALI